MSINVRPATQEGKCICELNNATGESESSSVLQSKDNGRICELRITI